MEAGKLLSRWMGGALLAVALCASAAPAQDEPAPGHVEGRIVDTDGRPIPGLVVSVGRAFGGSAEPPGDDAPRAVTDDDGRYRLDGVPVGDNGLFVAPEGVSGGPEVLFESPNVARLDLHLPRLARARIVLRDVDDVPVAGARVRGSWNDVRGQHRELDVRSAADGGFVVPAVGGVFGGWFQVDADGFVQPARFRLADFVRDVEDLETWTLSRGASLTGVVTGPDGPVAGATVCLAVPRVLHPLRRTAATDASGRYAFVGVPAGRAAVRVTAEGLAHAVHPGSWATPVDGAEPADGLLDVPRSGSLEHDVELVRGVRLTGVVRGPDGKPVAGAIVAVPAHGQTPVPVITDAEGRYALAGVPPVAGLSVAARKGFEQLALETVDLSNSPEASTCDFDLPHSTAPSRASGVRVRTKEGRVPDGLRIVMERRFGRGGAPVRWRWSGETFANDEGLVEVRSIAEGPLPGPWRLRVEAPGFEPAYSEPFDASSVDSLPEIVLRVAGRRSGKVIHHPTGEPVAGAWIVDHGFQDHPGRPGPFLGRVVRAVTDATGGFRLANAPARTERPFVAYAHGHLSAPVAFTTQDGSWEFRLVPCHALRGTVVDEEGEPVAGALLLPGSGQGWRRLATAADGTFRVATHPARDVDLLLRAPPRRAAEFGIGDIGPFDSDQSNVRIRLPRRAAIRGSVLDEEGAPIAGASVWLVTQQLRKAPHTARQDTDADGRFTFEPVVPDVYQLAIKAPGRVPLLAPDVAPGKEHVHVLDAGLVVAGRVSVPSGVDLTRISLVLEQPLPRPRLRLGGGDDFWPPWIHVPLGDDGEFRVAGLSPGEYLVKVQGPKQAKWMRGLRTVSTLVAGETDQHIRVVRSRPLLLGLVAREPAELRSVDVVIEAHAEDGETTQRVTLSSTRDTLRLVDAAYLVVIRPADPKTVRFDGGPRVIEAGAPVEPEQIELRARRIGTLHGRLLDAIGIPVRGRSIRLVGPTEEDDVTVFANVSTGRFRARRYPHGRTTAWLVPDDEQGAPLRLGTFEFAGEDVTLSLPE